MSEHVEAHTDRASRRRAKGDRRVARAALHKAGNPDVAAARLRCQATNAEDLAALEEWHGRPSTSLHQRAERARRAAALLESGDVSDPRPGPAR